MSRRTLARTLLAYAAVAAAISLAGCYGESGMMPGRALAPLSDKMLAEIEQKKMSKDSPILVRIFKTEAELEVWKQDRDGKYALLKSYPICRWSGDLGPKVKEGDRQAPEGFYNITPGLMNPNSQYYLAFNMGFPNSYDSANGRTGQFLMVHGDCSSRGCYAMTDEQMTEIYALARESFFGGQKSFQVQAYPFRMTPVNMAKHRNSPHIAYWKMIKQGYDHFEVTRQEPKVDVCEKRYVFDAVAPENASRPVSFNSRGKCPVFEIPRDIRDAINEKRRQDEIQTAELVARGTPLAPNRAGVDGGMNPIFLAKLEQGVSLQNIDRKAFLTPAPGTIPGHVIPPSASFPVEAEEPAPAPRPAPVMVASNVPVPRPAPLTKEGSAPEPEAPKTIASLIGNMFGNTNQAKPAPAETQPEARETVVASAVPASKTKPEPVYRTASRAPVKPEPKYEPEPPAPKVAAANPAPTAAWPKPDPVAWPAPKPVVARAPVAQPQPEPAPPAPKVAVARAPVAPPPPAYEPPPAPKAVARAPVVVQPQPAPEPPAPKVVARAPVVIPPPAPEPPAPKAVARAPIVQPKPAPAPEPPKAVARAPAVQPKPRAVEEAAVQPDSSSMRSSFAAPAASKAGLLSGAQPVVPVGAFANR
ncbi:MAG: murein L,D-transpeptidase family protein [Hyphomicrobiales bacterium]